MLVQVDQEGIVLAVVDTDRVSHVPGQGFRACHGGVGRAVHVRIVV